MLVLSSGLVLFAEQCSGLCSLVNSQVWDGVFNLKQGIKYSPYRDFLLLLLLLPSRTFCSITSLLFLFLSRGDEYPDLSVATALRLCQAIVDKPETRGNKDLVVPLSSFLSLRVGSGLQSRFKRESCPSQLVWLTGSGFISFRLLLLFCPASLSPFSYLFLVRDESPHLSIGVDGSHRAPFIFTRRHQRTAGRRRRRRRRSPEHDSRGFFRGPVHASLLGCSVFISSGDNRQRVLLYHTYLDIALVQQFLTHFQCSCLSYGLLRPALS